MIKPIIAYNDCAFAAWPINTGKTIFPDPKNIENIAKPVDIMGIKYFNIVGCSCTLKRCPRNAVFL